MEAFGKYIKHLVIAFISLLLFTVVLNRVIDPFWFFGDTSIAKINRNRVSYGDYLRYAKTYQINRIKPEGLILGTSRAEIGLNPDHKGWKASPVFNAALTRGTIYEVYRYFQHANRTKPLKQVVLNLDFIMFLTNKQYMGGFKEERLLPEKQSKIFVFKEYTSALFSFVALRESIRTVWTNLFDDRPLPDNGMNDGRQREKDVAKYGIKGNFIGSEKAYMVEYYFPDFKYSFCLKDAHTGYTPMDYYRKLLREAYENNIDVKITISPSHARQWEIIIATKLYEHWFGWKQALADINEQEAKRAYKKTYPIWDFSGYNSVTTVTVPADGVIYDSDKAKRWGYYEASHFKKEIGDLVLNRIFSVDENKTPDDFGVLLNSLNIRQHYMKTTKNRYDWQKRHMSDYREIADMYWASINWMPKSYVCEN